MRYWSGWLAAVAVLAVGSAAPASAAGEERVALMPVVAVNADPANAERMTRALAADLGRNGCKLVEEDSVREAVGEEAVALSRPQFVPALVRVGARVGADLVVYARVLVQGPAVQDHLIDPRRQALILHVMIVDARSGELLLTKQIAQEWVTPTPQAAEQTVTEDAAATAAQRLLELLYQPASLSGVLLDTDSGRPLGGVEAFIRQDGVEARVVLTDEQGRFSFRSLARRSCTVTTHAPGYHDTAQHLPFALGERQVSLALAPRAASLSGIVRGADGAPLVGQQVRILDADGRALDSLLTLSDGSFGRGGLRTGRYTIAVSLPGGDTCERSVDLRPGDLLTVELSAR
jgi:hypothetical protein